MIEGLRSQTGHTEASQRFLKQEPHDEIPRARVTGQRLTPSTADQQELGPQRRQTATRYITQDREDRGTNALASPSLTAPNPTRGTPLADSRWELRTWGMQSPGVHPFVMQNRERGC